jgi:hypothetical protein
MQAGRVSPQAHWTNPCRKPVKRRNSARIDDAVLRGFPTGPSGAAEPTRRKGTGERGPGSRGEAAAPSRPSACARVQHALAMASLSACVPSPLVADPRLPSSTTLPLPPSSSWSWAHHPLTADRRPRLHLLVHAASGDGTPLSPGAWFQASLLLLPLLRSYLCCGPLPGNFFHSDLRVDCNL